MQLTIQAEEILRFNKIIRWIIRKPRYHAVHFIDFHGKLAIALHHFDWSIVMPLQGRRPIRPFKIQYKYLQSLPESATGKMIVRIRPEKGLGDVQRMGATGWKKSDPFLFRLDNLSVEPTSDEATELKGYPVSLLDDIWRCVRMTLRPAYGNLCCIHLMPDGEVRSTDGHQALAIQTPYTFDCDDQTLIRSCELFGKRELRRQKTFRMGFNGKTVHFDFGVFHFLTYPQIERYPDTRKVIPAEETIRTHLTLDPADAAFLKKHLADLPGREEADAPVTLLCHYDNSVSVYGDWTNREDVTAIRLVRSRYEGDAYILRMNRKHLLHALQLGCLDFRFGTSYPLALTENVKHCWVQLDGGALPLESELPPLPTTLLLSDQPVPKKGSL